MRSPVGAQGANALGIDFTVFSKLVEFSTRHSVEGRSLMLGRQEFVRLRPPRIFQRKLRREGLDHIQLEDLQQSDGYSETFFRKLGFGEVETMDFSDHEGATILQDLNRPIPKELAGQFDFIFDGGTIEHVFNVPVALENVFHMLKPGGHFISVNGLNGWAGHGMYQFNPELVYSFWRRNAGCVVNTCQAIQRSRAFHQAILDLQDPADGEQRIDLGDALPDGQVYLYYEIQRGSEAALMDTVLQSDYETHWRDYSNAGGTRYDQKVSSL
ncbi:class I SAM-dependent methyltransferase [Ruegeria sp. HKCCD6109]|uniref:methyltransferase domain-containing protein n=1 Tax=Ruegeria sp. HKCCD6109 TaxID=2683017 RepID=UPI001487CE89|nr:class I SAM-dependent methyltransferase [Ruegeria sp. HKCCD6109]